MDILILGNGFDLAHDLETKYSDFLEFCKKKYSINTIGSISNNDSFSNNFWLRHFIINEIPNNKWIDLEYEIYNVIKSISNQLFSHRNLSSVELLFPTCYEFPIDYIKDNFDLRNIVKDLKNINKKSTKLSPKEYTFSEGYYSNYLEVNFETYKGFVNFLFEQLQEFTKMFNNYLIEEIIPNINVKKYSFALQAHKSIRVGFISPIWICMFI